jgi:dolichyl-phosphate-mannose--protein O-mannosyl transferase
MKKNTSFAMYDPKAKYPCTIVKCEDTKSQKTGDAMFIATVHIFNESGGYRIVTAYTMGEGNAEWQLRSAAEAFNVLESYKMGSINAHDLEGKSAFAKVGIEED